VAKPASSAILVFLCTPSLTSSNDHAPVHIDLRGSEASTPLAAYMVSNRRRPPIEHCRHLDRIPHPQLAVFPETGSGYSKNCQLGSWDCESGWPCFLADECC